MAKVLEIIGDGGCEAVIGECRLSAHRICFRLATPMDIITLMPKITQTSNNSEPTKRWVKLSQSTINEIREALSAGKNVAEILKELQEKDLIRADYRLNSFYKLIERHVK